MPLFKYKAMSRDGAVLCGVESAISADRLRETLAQQGLFAHHISRSIRLSFRATHLTIPPAQFLLWVTSLLSLLKSGISIYEAIQVMQSDKQNKKIQPVLEKLLVDLKNGRSLSDALTKHVRSPDNVFIAAVRTGEKTGDLVSSLTQYKTYLARRLRLQKKLTQALAYPAFLVLTLVVIMGLLLGFVLPRFTAMYNDFGRDLPMMTQALLGLVDHLPLILTALALFAGASLLVSRLLQARLKWLVAFSHAIESIPLLGDSMQDARAARFADTLSTLLDAGLSLPDAFRVLASSERGKVQAYRLNEAAQSLQQGKSITEAVKLPGLIPVASQTMLGIGERSGSVAQMLSDIANVHHERLENTLKTLMSLIEPAIILLMGLLVGAVIIAMYLPIFYIVEVVA